VLGALTITGEYGTGMIRSTFAAAPTRIPALLGKATVLFATVFAASSLAVALSWLVSLPFLGQLGQSVDLTSAETWRILGSAPLYLATMSVLALAVGVLVRHSAAAIAIVIGLVLVIESVISAIPLRFFELIGPFLPATAGGRLLMDETTLDFMGSMGGTQLGPWQGYGVLVAWVAVLLTAALALARSRDA
jgi:ABC-2 type transport system permease protein